MTLQHQRKPNALHDLGYKIFLDRYAQKDMTRSTLAVGDTVIVVVNSQTGQREIGVVTALNLPEVTIALNDGETVVRDIEHVDKPIETDPGQMMDRVAAGIAQIEATPELRQTWTDNFRWLLEDWKFVPGGRILTGAGTDQKLTYYNCLPPEQEILTEHGYKPIGDVQIGERVVTHRNRLRRVLHRFEREAHEPMYTLHPKKVGYDAVRVTGEHKIMVIRSEWVNKHKSRDGLRLAQEPQWIPANDLKPGDMVALAYNGEYSQVQTLRMSDYIGLETLLEDQTSVLVSTHNRYELQDRYLVKSLRDTNGTKITRTFGMGRIPLPVLNDIVLDEDLCILLGRWLGDGCITHRTGTTIPSGIKIVFNLNERLEAEQMARIVEEKFGIPAALKVSSTKRWLDLWINSMPLGEFFKALFGTYSYGKRIPDVLMTLPDNLTLALLKGLFGADGYISDNKLGMVLSNKSLSIQFHQLLLRLGYLFSIRENTHRLGKHPAYRIQATTNECEDLFKQLFDRIAPPFQTDTKHYIEYNDLKWVRIDRIEVEMYRGMVMDIEVEEDHSFVTAGVVVSNCYVISSPRDSREGIMETLTYMTEIMSRGGGVGINISSLRPRHAYVRGVNGRSSGSVSWGGLYSFVTGLIEQGGSRRGALMLILNDWHPDVFSFISSKREAGQITNANISVGISDTLMQRIRADGDWTLMFPDTSDPTYDAEWDGDLEKWQAAGKKVIPYKTVKAREIWDAIIESAWASAEPGLWFRERSNKMSNSYYFSNLISTNPCLTGDTRLFTDQGLVTLQELFDEETEFKVAVDGRFGISNSFLPSTRVFMTGVKPVFRLQTREGYSVRATANHRFMTSRGWKELQDLKPGDVVHVMNRKGGFGQQGSLELGRVLGWLIGDGTIKKDRAVLSFFGNEKQELAPVFAQYVNDLVAPITQNARTYSVNVVNVGGRDEARVQSERLRTMVARYGLLTKKHQVPEIVFKGTEEMQRGFLQALFTADGSIQGSAQKGASVRLSSSVVTLLEQVQILLSNFGLVSRIYKNRRKEQMRSMPDGKGGYKDYLTKAQHELVLSSRSLLDFMSQIGFLMEYKNEAFRRILEGYVDNPYSSMYAAVVESVTADGEEAVYDLTVDSIHANIVNGIVSHNCGEQPLSAWSVCNLGAINLARFYDETTQDVDWTLLGRTVSYATRFLDNIIDGTPYFFDQNRQTQMDERRVGLGTMGIAELMIKCQIRYGSDESVEFIDKVYKFIACTAYETSAQLAVEKGAFPQFNAEKFLQSGFMQGMPENIREMIRECGIRNVTLLTQAPTGTTGTMVNASTGIEPFFSWMYYRKSRLGLHEEKMPIAQEWFDANPGETQLPDYFVTAMELAPEDHVKVQGAFQRWVDSAISKTCNVPNSYTVSQVGKLYEMMYDLGCKGGTIYRDGSRSEQVLMLKGDERAETEMADLKKKEADQAAAEDKTEAPATPHRVYSRPTVLQGTTVSFKTPFGTSYITMNSDEHGCPFEVFITVGKAGSDVQADAEALGRLISLQLRATAPHNRMEMLKLVIDQLQNIGGARPVGFGQNRVLSLPDAVARALEMHYVNAEEPPHQLALPGLNGNGKSNVVLQPAETAVPTATNGHVPHEEKSATMSGADMCPECGTISLVRAEGCRRCLTCDYTEC